MQLSARNQLRGTVVAVTRGATTAMSSSMSAATS